MKRMRFLDPMDNEVVDFDPYFQYLGSIAGLLPGHVYAFASDYRRYSLEDRESLHDSWVQELSLQEQPSGPDNRQRKLNAKLVLLGPYHDRVFELYYKNVASYDLHYPPHKERPRPNFGHGDLLVHEFGFSENSLVEHFIVFESKAFIYFEFADMDFTEAPI